MEQRTCNIIMCCKGHLGLSGCRASSIESVVAYMSNECACPKETYTKALIESILREALFDYINCADNPGFELRQLFHQYALSSPSLSERICTMFQLTKVRNGSGDYVNGFTETLISQSRKDLNSVD